MPHWLALRLPPSEQAAAQAAGQMRALGWWALQFTPRVLQLEEAVLMEVQASLRLFGGERGLHARLRQELAAWQRDWACGSRAGPGVQPDAGPGRAPDAEPGVVPVAVAAGPTSLAALALLRAGRCAWPQAGGESADTRAAQQDSDAQDSQAAQAATLLAPLPLHTLSAAAVHEPTLARLGCRSLGQLRALPRGGVSRRFGAGLLLALDQAHGEAAETHDWLSLPEVFDQRMELPGRVDAAPALMFAAQRLLAQLASWLAARHAGVRCIRLGWRHDFFGPRQAGAGGELTIRTADCTRRVEHLARLLAEQLARTELAAPVGAIALRADEVEPLAPPSGTLWAGVGAAAEQAHRQQWTQLVERLSSRLGPDRVRSARPRADHRLQARQVWVPACERLDETGRAAASVAATASASTTAFVAARRAAPGRRHAAAASTEPGAGWPEPAWLVDQPLPLGTRGERPVYQGPLQLMAGPQRLESGWWVEAAQPAATLPPAAALQPAGASAACGAAPSAAAPQSRDYFVAFSARAGLLCIYRERLPQPGGHGWFLHGFYG